MQSGRCEVEGFLGDPRCQHLKIDGGEARAKEEDYDQKDGETLSNEGTGPRIIRMQIGEIAKFIGERRDKTVCNGQHLDGDAQFSDHNGVMRAIHDHKFQVTIGDREMEPKYHDSHETDDREVNDRAVRRDERKETEDRRRTNT